MSPQTGFSSVTNGYLELMKGCLTRTLFIEDEVREIQINDWRRWIWPPGLISKLAGSRVRVLVAQRVDAEARRLGKDWPRTAETMIGLERLGNIQHCVAEVIRQGVPGDLIETGVWRGGACIFMRAVLAAYGVRDRRVWVADSFRGLPPPHPDRYPADEGLDLSGFSELAITVDRVKANFARYGLLDDQVEFLVGWFKDTLPDVQVSRFAVVRLDGDLYESTMDAIAALYPKLSLGGYLIVDDYYAVSACKEAVTDYRTQHKISESVREIDGSGAYWQREK